MLTPDRIEFVLDPTSACRNGSGNVVPELPAGPVTYAVPAYAFGRFRKLNRTQTILLGTVWIVCKCAGLVIGLQAPVHPALVAAMLGDRRDADVLLDGGH